MVETTVNSATQFWWGSGNIGGIETSPPAIEDVAQRIRGAYVTSPAMDTHTHGCHGFRVSDSPDEMTQLISAYQSLGVGRVQLSTVTLADADVHLALNAARSVMATDRALVGIHLEGPFLSPEKKGAHDQHLLRRASRESIEEMLSDYLDVVSSVTLDPLSVDEGVIAWLVAHGVTVAIGHTTATYAQASRAFQEGARILTHAFNAMLPIASREPGPVMAAIDEGAYLEVIADGHHVHPSLVTMLFREAPGRVILVTDSMPAAGVGDGHFSLGPLEVSVVDGVARTHDGALAGSTLTLPDAVRNAHRFGVPAEKAIAAATATPVEAYGLDAPELKPGDIADVAVWSEDAELTHTITQGMVADITTV